MNKHLHLICVLSMVAALKPALAAAEPLSQTVRVVTGLQLGTYVGRPDADESCVDGELTMKDQADGHVTIFLGGHVLIPNISADGRHEPEEAGWTVRSDFSAHRITWYREGRSKTGRPVQFQTLLNVSDWGFSYASTYHNKPFTCVLTRR